MAASILGQAHHRFKLGQVATCFIHPCLHEKPASTSRTLEFLCIGIIAPLNV